MSRKQKSASIMANTTMQSAPVDFAIDAMFEGLKNYGHGRTDSRLFATRHTGETRQGVMRHFSLAIKEITNKPHHISSTAHQYWRAEAIFAVQTTQHLLALVGALRAEQLLEVGKPKRRLRLAVMSGIITAENDGLAQPSSLNLVK